MIKVVEFTNYKVLQSTKLPLSPFNLLIGPNGSGKSTFLKGLRHAVGQQGGIFSAVVSAGVEDKTNTVAIKVVWGDNLDGAITEVLYTREGRETLGHHGRNVDPDEQEWIVRALLKMPIYSLDPRSIAAPVQAQPGIILTDNGTNLAGVLDNLRDDDPERFEALNDELPRWMPEFNRVLFDAMGSGTKVVVLRTRDGHRIKANDLSDGTLLALAMLTIAYLPTSPPIIGFEEPDRGLHPRLLRYVRDALYRLAYPDAGDKREPVQVIATTHSPYLLDLFREHPEEIIIAHKVGSAAQLERLSDRSDLEDILRDVHLGEAWYSGIFGGVPIES